MYIYMYMQFRCICMCLNIFLTLIFLYLLLMKIAEHRLDAVTVASFSSCCCFHACYMLLGSNTHAFFFPTPLFSLTILCFVGLLYVVWATCKLAIFTAATTLLARAKANAKRKKTLSWKSLKSVYMYIYSIYLCASSSSQKIKI